MTSIENSIINDWEQKFSKNISKYINDSIKMLGRKIEDKKNQSKNVYGKYFHLFQRCLTPLFLCSYQ